jgi:hypothetical protein
MVDTPRPVSLALSQNSIGVVITEDETYRKGRQARANPLERNRWALTDSGLDLETKIFSTSGRGRTFSLTSLFIELIDRVASQTVCFDNNPVLL